MVDIIKTGKIESSGSIAIKGKLVKILVTTKNKTTNVRVKIQSTSGETLIDDNLQDKNTVFYPRCVIIMEENNTQLDYYYLYEYVKIEVYGLSEIDSIEDIIFYVE